MSFNLYASENDETPGAIIIVGIFSEELADVQTLIDQEKYTQAINLIDSKLQSFDVDRPNAFLHKADLLDIKALLFDTPLMNQRDQAAPIHDEIIKLVDAYIPRGNFDYERSLYLLNAAYLYFYINDFEKSSLLAKRLIKEYSGNVMVEQNILIDAYWILGGTLLEQEKFYEAKKLYNKLIRLLRGGPQSPSNVLFQFNVNINLGLKTLSSLGEVKSAKNYLHTALNLLPKIKEINTPERDYYAPDEDIHRLFIALYEATLQEGQYEQSIKYFQQAIEMMRPPNEDWTLVTGNYVSNLTDTCSNYSYFADLNTDFNSLPPLQRKLFADTLLNFFNDFLNSKAIEGHDEEQLIFVLDCMANLHVTNNNYLDAQNYAQLAINKIKSSSELREFFGLYFERFVADMDTKMNNFNGALVKYQEIYENQEKLIALNPDEDLTTLNHDLMNIATLLDLLGLSDQYQEILNILSAKPNLTQFQKIKLLNKQGIAYLDQDEYQKAIDTFLEALNLTKKAKKIHTELYMKANLGTAHSYLWEDKIALNYAKEVLRSIERNNINDQSLKGWMISEIYALSNTLGYKQQAELYRKKATSFFIESNYLLAEEISYHIETLANQLEKAYSEDDFTFDEDIFSFETYTKTKNLLELLVETNINDSPQKNIIFTQQMSYDYAFLIDYIVEVILGELEFETDPFQEFVELSELYKTSSTARTISNLSRRREIVGNQELRKLVREYQNLIRLKDIKYFSHSNDNELYLRSNEIDNLLEKKLKNQILKLDPTYFENREVDYDIDKMQMNLKDNQAVLYYVDTGEDFLHLLIIKKDAVTMYTRGWEEVDEDTLEVLDNATGGIDLAIEGLRKPFDKVLEANQLLPFDATQSFELYKILIPDETELNGINDLIIIPDGALYDIPFQLLITSDPKDQKPQEYDWLNNHYSINVTSSIKSLVSDEEINEIRKINFLGIGNPSLDLSAAKKKNIPLPIVSNLLTRNNIGRISNIKRLPALPDTAIELKNISERLQNNNHQATLFLGSDATESLIKTIDLSEYNVISFATHTLVPQSPSGYAEPAIVLTPPNQASGFDDGLLTSNEIMNLHLDADLIILSACNTAASGGLSQDVYSGLAESFIFAGAKNVLVSHWPVVSEAAVEIMTNLFQEKMSKPDLSYAQALQLSTAKLAKNRMYEHPLFWAPFSVFSASPLN